MRTVKVLKRDGQAALVEWLDGDMPRRVFLPTGIVPDSGLVEDEELGRGISYGVEWADEIALTATARDLQRNLRSAGVWTAEDAADRAAVVQGVIQATYGIDTAAVLTVARKQQRRL